MNYCQSCGIELKITPINYCYNCGFNLSDSQSSMKILDEHPFASYIKKNPDKIAELTDIINDDPIFKNVEEINQLARVFEHLPFDLKLELEELFEIEVNKAKEQVIKVAGQGTDIFYSAISRRNNLRYILWALKGLDVEKNLLEEFNGRKYYLYPGTATISETKDKNDGNINGILDLLDLFISLSSPTSAAKYFINKAKTN